MGKASGIPPMLRTGLLAPILTRSTSATALSGQTGASRDRHSSITFNIGGVAFLARSCSPESLTMHAEIIALADYCARNRMNASDQARCS
jgi:hypothetical protein